MTVYMEGREKERVLSVRECLMFQHSKQTHKTSFNYECHHGNLISNQFLQVIWLKTYTYQLNQEWISNSICPGDKTVW